MPPGFPAAPPSSHSYSVVARPSQNRACAIYAHGSSQDHSPACKQVDLCLVGYAAQFRFHRFPGAGAGRCFLTTLDHTSSPFLQRHYPPSQVLRDDPTSHTPQAPPSFFRSLALSPVRGRGHGTSRVATFSCCHACHGLRPRRSGRRLRRLATRSRVDFHCYESVVLLDELAFGAQSLQPFGLRPACLPTYA